MSGLTFLLVGSAAWWQVQAEDAPAKPQPLQLKLKLVQVADTRPPQFFIMLDGLPSTNIYKSFSSLTLRTHIRNFPDGTIISWNGHFNGRLLSQNPENRKEIGDVKDFADYCEKEGVAFHIQR